MIECDNCGREFAPVATRWLCPYCKYKASCCEGEPQDLHGSTGPVAEQDRQQEHYSLPLGSQLACVNSVKGDAT